MSSLLHLMIHLGITHLDSKGETIDSELEKKRFAHAGDILKTLMMKQTNKYRRSLKSGNAFMSVNHSIFCKF